MLPAVREEINLACTTTMAGQSSDILALVYKRRELPGNRLRLVLPTCGGLPTSAETFFWHCAQPSWSKDSIIDCDLYAVPAWLSMQPVAIVGHGLQTSLRIKATRNRTTGGTGWLPH